MPERFNFYDLFGFFIPGSILLLSLWLPFGVTTRTLPDTDLPSALIGIIVAYVVGHFLQVYAQFAHPSSIDGRPRSTVMLDAGSSALEDKTKGTVVAFAREEFSLDLVPPPGDPRGADADRKIAFFQARQRLLSTAHIGYAEQFQGLYTMMRGNMVAALIAAYYVAGWAVSLPMIWPLGAALAGLGALAALVDIAGRPAQGSDMFSGVEERTHARRVLNALCVLAFGAGMLLASSASIGTGTRMTFVAICMLLTAITYQSERSYFAYADEFARAVYRGFVEAVNAQRRQP